MRRTFAILVLSAIAISGAFAQRNQPPLLLPPTTGPTPPPLFVPPPVPPANPPPASLPSGYGTPPGISTATPLTGTPRVIYREPDYRAPKKKRWKRRHRPS